MGRLKTVTDLATSSSIISGATYGPSNQMLSLSGNVNETRTYNSMVQLTSVNNGYGGAVNITYAYPSSNNNGKIASQTDNISGEVVQYTYDAVNRLLTATESTHAWGESYGYDGFGNLTGQTPTYGSPPSYSVTPDPTTNHLGSTDANGNSITVNISGTNFPASYDVANRLVSIGYGNNIAYNYTPGNKRVWRGLWSSGSLTTDEVTFWSVTGQKLATYSLSMGTRNQACYPNYWQTCFVGTVTATQTGTNYYFGRKLIKNASGYVGADRLGSVGKYYPYGQEKPSATTNGTEKFTGYFRDSETTLDYAKNRYHNPGTGRFLTPDPYMASGGSRDPGSWNRYAYVEGDPVNRIDPTGLEYFEAGDGSGDDESCGPDWIWDASLSGPCEGGGGGGGGGGGEPAPPQLMCSFSAFTGSAAPVPGTYTNGTAQIAGYGLPTQLTFSAQGGTGSYTWAETQTVVRYLTSPTNVITLLNSGTDQPLYWSARPVSQFL